MKKLFFAFILFFSLVIPSFAYASTSTTVKVNKDGHSTIEQKVYVSQNVKSKSLGKLKKNQNTYVYTKKNNWYQVKIGTKKGWVSTKNIKLGKYTPPVTKINKDGHSTIEQKVYVSQNTKSKSLGTLKKNQNVYVYNKQNGWYQVKIGSKKGWVSTKNIKLGKYTPPVTKINKDGHSTIEQKVYVSQNTKSKSLGTLKKNQNVYVYNKQNGWYQVKIGSKKGWVSTKNIKLGKYTPPVTKINKDGHSTIEQKVYVSQNTKSKSLGTLKKNQNVYVYNKQNGWYQVKIGSKKGWVLTKNIKLGKYTPPVTKINKDGHSTIEQKVYASQNTKSKSLGTLKKNQNVYVYNKQNGWYQVKIGSKKGWVSTKNINLGKYVAPVSKLVPNTYIVRNDVIVYGSGDTQIGTLKKGQKITAKNAEEINSSVKITLNGKTASISRQDLMPVMTAGTPEYTAIEKVVNSMKTPNYAYSSEYNIAKTSDFVTIVTPTSSTALNKPFPIRFFEKRSNGHWYQCAETTGILNHGELPFGKSIIMKGTFEPEYFYLGTSSLIAFVKDINLNYKGSVKVKNPEEFPYDSVIIVDLESNLSKY